MVILQLFFIFFYSVKGEETLYLYEILEEEPFFQVLTPYKAEGLHFALAFLPKIYCDIRSAEIGKAYRLTKDNRVERMSFLVPRVKVSYKRLTKSNIVTNNR